MVPDTTYTEDNFPISYSSKMDYQKRAMSLFSWGKGWSHWSMTWTFAKVCIPNELDHESGLLCALVKAANEGREIDGDKSTIWMV